MESTISTWIDAYRTAWRTNDPADIRALFTEDAVYYDAPYREPARGHDGIVAWWLGSRDEPESYTFEWHPIEADERHAFVQGVTSYSDGHIYSNLWVIRFAEDGRASEFTEWWMDQSESP